MLRPKKRISRKEIKQDKLVTLYFKINDWFAANSKIVIGSVIALIIIAFTVFFINSRNQRMEKQASVKLATASLMIENSRNETAIDSLFSLVSEYGNTKSGRIGRFYLANAYYNQGQYEMAESKFREFISKGIDDPLLKSSAMNGVAACLEQKQLYDQAAAQYLKSARKYPDQIYASSSLYDAGRCYRLAGNNEKAKELFNELIKAYPESDETYKARTELAFLEENDSDTSVINVSP